MFSTERLKISKCTKLESSAYLKSTSLLVWSQQIFSWHRPFIIWRQNSAFRFKNQLLQLYHGKLDTHWNNEGCSIWKDHRTSKEKSLWRKKRKHKYTGPVLWRTSPCDCFRYAIASFIGYYKVEPETGSNFGPEKQSPGAIRQNIDPDSNANLKWKNTLVYMLWFNFILGLNFIFHCFKLIIIH